MNSKVLLPPHYENIQGPLIFLGGPIQGAPYWHNNAIQMIQNNSEKIDIASPSRRVDKIYLDANPTSFRNSSNQEGWEQVDWETFHLNQASKNGCILFWLPLEVQHYCDRPYAQTSRVEIGEWKTKHLENGCNLVIGFQPDFSGEHYLRYRLTKECPDIPICSSLEETCLAAIKSIRLHRAIRSSHIIKNRKRTT
ncbi:hypothetical protein CMI37_17420 [Candidatus Pacearchaeota archaeon]|nr:hypothetical protein [Candidatus Pacearchaeota archaeon]|tara:strand:+ start:3097 stop:3681 length:585 start_codon:yes stop_codon:yes gene_type:complete